MEWLEFVKVMAVIVLMFMTLMLDRMHRSIRKEGGHSAGFGIFVTSFIFIFVAASIIVNVIM